MPDIPPNRAYRRRVEESGLSHPDVVRLESDDALPGRRHLGQSLLAAMTRGHWVAFLLVLALAATGSAILAARLASRHARGHDHAHSGASEKDFHAFLHARLQPTPEQAMLLDPLEQRYEEERLRLRGEIDAASKDLAAAIRAGRRESKDVGDALARLHGLQGELQRKTLDHFFEMKEHLDPTQAALLLELTHDSILNRHEH